MGCPMGADKEYCPRCLFEQQGKCNYKAIMAHAIYREELYKKLAKAAEYEPPLVHLSQ